MALGSNSSLVSLVLGGNRGLGDEEAAALASSQPASLTSLDLSEAQVSRGDRGKGYWLRGWEMQAEHAAW